MKKILFSLMVCLAALTASAQNYTFQSFLNVRALGTGTNGIGITNLTALVTNVGMVHSTNVFWTNSAGSLTRSAGAAGGTNTQSAFPLFRDVRLYTDREGRLPIAAGNFLSPQTTNLTNNTIGLVSLLVAFGGNFGTNGPLGINIAPIWDGTPNVTGTTNFTGHPNTPTSTADDFSVLFATGSGYTTLTTNLPVWRWPGAYGLRIRTITNQFGGGGENFLTNSPYIYRLGISSYIP